MNAPEKHGFCIYEQVANIVIPSEAEGPAVTV
jgi:hypothetical protein